MEQNAERPTWSGPVERYIRKVVSEGRNVYRVQMGPRGRGNRRSRLCATLAEAQDLKRAWTASGLPSQPIRLRLTPAQRPVAPLIVEVREGAERMRFEITTQASLRAINALLHDLLIQREARSS